VDARADAEVVADMHRLTQAVLQLADNAVKFTGPDDEVGIGTLVLDGPAGRRARLWVRDTGPGVPPEEADRIFDRFARGSTTGGVSGSGLGLAIVRAIAQGHGGDVVVERPDGGGARFVMTWPGAGAPPAGPAGTPAGSTVGHAGRYQERGDRGEGTLNQILIAEDEERIAQFVRKGLKAHGFQPTVVSDGASALAHAMSGGYDLMVLDIGLPLLDGFTVLQRLRDVGSTLPVVILTARDSLSDRVAGLEGGADDYMSKPFGFDELLARIKLRLRRATGEAAASDRLEHGDVGLDLRTRTATAAGREVELSAREFALAEVFLQHPGQVMSREQLLSRVWGYDFDPGSNVVDVYVRYLRKKLGADRIETVRGAGYRFKG
jgi:DNA-binding response OmpR family regulator